MQISVIVPVRDEENSIRDLLDGLLSQTYPASEIVITDGGSKDNTAAIIEEYIKRGEAIRLVRSGPALPGRARNLAANAAQGEWLALIDAGVKPAADWLERLAAAAAGVDVVYGDYEPVTDTMLKTCAAIAYVSPPRPIGSIVSRPRSIASALMRKKVWQTVGGFPEALRSAEDLLFMQKVDDCGFAVTYEPRAIVRWNLQPTLWKTFRRFISYSRNNMRAGLWRDWQARVFSRYAFIALSVLPAITIGARWLIVPLLLWLLMLLARAFVAIRRNRNCFPASLNQNVTRVFVVAFLIAVVDVAAFVGVAQWLIADRSRTAEPLVEANHGS